MDVDHLYIHVPFCERRCGYCDFTTTSLSPELHHRYVESLKRELEVRVHGSEPQSGFDTIYIGGGTPTALEPVELKNLMEWVKRLTNVEAEVTIECNPETVNDRLVSILSDSAVTRVSLGVQSTSETVLKSLDRRASESVSVAAFRMLRDAGFENISMDLIWGAPGSTLESTREDLDFVIGEGADHISAYELMIKKGTKVSYALEKGWQHSDSEEMFDLVVGQLKAAGYEWYETSNFAKPGRQCRHNVAIWNQQDYLGIGIGAVGTVGGLRRTNRPSIALYLGSLEESGEEIDAPHSMEALSETDQVRERLLLKLRTSEPCIVAPGDREHWFDTEALGRMSALGLVVLAEGSVALSEAGRKVENSVLAEIIR